MLEPNDVLNQFLDLCDKNTGFLQHHLAPNATLECFGKSIRGTYKIYSFIRYRFSQEYEQHFDNARQCDPIETRSTHFQTKQIPSSCKKVQQNDASKKKSEPISFMEFSTPIQDRKSPVLPPIICGKLFRPMINNTSSDDDDGDDDDDNNNELLSVLGLSSIPDEITPPPKTIEPPEKKIKPEEKPTKTHNMHNNISNNSMQNMEKIHLIYELEQNNDFSTSDDEDDDEEQISSTHPDYDDELKNLNSSTNNYSKLLYLEAIGVLRIKKPYKSKNRSTSKNRSLYDEDDANNERAEGGEEATAISTSMIYSPSYCKNRETRLKMSYRINLLDNQIQFALIIYEPINPNLSIKRNLFLEFEKFGELEIDSENENGNGMGKELKRKSAVKRNLRL